MTVDCLTHFTPQGPTKHAHRRVSGGWLIVLLVVNYPSSLSIFNRLQKKLPTLLTCQNDRISICLLHFSVSTMSNTSNLHSYWLLLFQKQTLPGDGPAPITNDSSRLAWALRVTASVEIFIGKGPTCWHRTSGMRYVERIRDVWRLASKLAVR